MVNGRAIAVLLAVLLAAPASAERRPAPAEEKLVEHPRFSIEVPPIVLTDVPVRRIVIRAYDASGKPDLSYNEQPLISGIRLARAAKRRRQARTVSQRRARADHGPARRPQDLHFRSGDRRRRRRPQVGQPGCAAHVSLAGAAAGRGGVGALPLAAEFRAGDVRGDLERAGDSGRRQPVPRLRADDRLVRQLRRRTAGHAGRDAPVDPGGDAVLRVAVCRAGRRRRAVRPD